MSRDWSFDQDQVVAAVEEPKVLEGYDAHQNPLPPAWKSPILFLDFDGVLNSLEYWYGSGYSGIDLLNHTLSPYNVAVVNSIFERVPSCEIVLSTAWRFFGFYHEYIAEVLRDAGFKGNVIGDLGTIEEPFGIRGIAIQVWLVNNNCMDRNICILDDMHRSKFGWLNGYLVKTNIATGCTEKEADLAVAMLKGEGKDYGKPKRWEAKAKD